MTEKKTILSKKVTGRRRALADSDESSTEYEKELLLPSGSTDFCKNCCSCRVDGRSYGIKSKEKRQSEPQLRGTSYRQQLESKVLNERASQQVSARQWRHLQNRLFNLNESYAVMDTLLNSVHVSTACLAKLSRLVSDRGGELGEKCDDILEKINEALETTRDSADGAGNAEDPYDFLSKKSDLSKASTNFSDILRRSPIPSNRQLSKLEKQYDDIRNRYADAKSKAVANIDSTVQKKTETLNDHFKKWLVPILSAFSDLEKQVTRSLAESNVELIKKRLESCGNWSVCCRSQRSASRMSAADFKRRNCSCCDSSN